MCGVGRKFFEELPKGRGRVLSQVFVATELHPDTYCSIFSPSNNIKNLKLSTFIKSVKKGLGLI